MTKKKKPKIRFDRDGWAMVHEGKPDNFEMVRIQNHSGDEQFAWWAGFRWDYGTKKIKGDPYRWKRLPRGYEF